jgi:hypothetical protein
MAEAPLVNEVRSMQTMHTQSNINSRARRRPSGISDNIKKLHDLPLLLRIIAVHYAAHLPLIAF